MHNKTKVAAEFYIFFNYLGSGQCCYMKGEERGGHAEQTVTLSISSECRRAQLLHYGFTV